MDELYCHGSLANSGRHSLYRTVPHVAHGKNAGDIGLEQERVAIESPSLGALPILNQIRAGQNESTLIAFDDTSQPIGSRRRSDEDEHRAGWHALKLVGVGTKNGNLFEMGIAMHLGYAGVRPQLNVRGLFNLVNQVLRHGAEQ